MVKKLESYVEDSPDLLRIFETENQNGPQPQNTIPVTIDVTGLYTNIPTYGKNGGKQAFEKALNSRPIEEKSKVPTEYLLELLDLVLNGNIFEFNMMEVQQTQIVFNNILIISSKKFFKSLHLCQRQFLSDFFLKIHRVSKVRFMRFY